MNFGIDSSPASAVARSPSRSQRVECSDSSEASRVINMRRKPMKRLRLLDDSDASDSDSAETAPVVREKIRISTGKRKPRLQTTRPRCRYIDDGAKAGDVDSGDDEADSEDSSADDAHQPKKPKRTPFVVSSDEDEDDESAVNNSSSDSAHSDDSNTLRRIRREERTHEAEFLDWRSSSEDAHSDIEECKDALQFGGNSGVLHGRDVNTAIEFGLLYTAISTGTPSTANFFAAAAVAALTTVVDYESAPDGIAPTTTPDRLTTALQTLQRDFGRLFVPGMTNRVDFCTGAGVFQTTVFQLDDATARAAISEFLAANRRLIRDSLTQCHRYAHCVADLEATPWLKCVIGMLLTTESRLVAAIDDDRELQQSGNAHPAPLCIACCSPLLTIEPESVSERALLQSPAKASAPVLLARCERTAHTLGIKRVAVDAIELEEQQLVRDGALNSHEARTETYRRLLDGALGTVASIDRDCVVPFLGEQVPSLLAAIALAVIPRIARASLMRALGSKVKAVNNTMIRAVDFVYFQTLPADAGAAMLALVAEFRETVCNMDDVDDEMPCDYDLFQASLGKLAAHQAQLEFAINSGKILKAVLCVVIAAPQLQTAATAELIDRVQCELRETRIAAAVDESIAKLKRGEYGNADSDKRSNSTVYKAKRKAMVATAVAKNAAVAAKTGVMGMFAKAAAAKAERVAAVERLGDPN